MEQARSGKRSPEVMRFYHRVFRAAGEFFFAPASARPLGALRIGIAAVLITQALMLRTEIFEFFAHNGIIQGRLADRLSNPDAPRIAWIVQWLSPVGISERSCIYAVCGTYFASLLLLAAGYRTRLAAAIAWLLHWILLNTGYTIIYGADQYAHIFLFYLIWVPAGHAYSLDVARGCASSAPTTTARLGLRVLQLHLCISYLASGIEKSTSIQWWNGEVLWRALSLPTYRQFDMSWLSGWPWLATIGCWATLAVELGYCVFIWPKRTRRPWIAVTMALHLGIAVCLGLHVFGIIMCVLTLAVFGVSPEPHEQQ
jgi:hypothetical protein